MAIRGISAFWRPAWWIRKRFEQRGLILLYHRVAALPSNPYLLSVTPQHFAEHLEILRKQAHPVTLQQLVQWVQDGRLPHRAVAITFDDGYADNLHNAKPLLERCDIPATFFVTTGYIGREREFWWDELDRLLLQPGTLPEFLHVSVNGRAYQWHLAEAANYSEDDYRHYCSWNYGQKHDPTPRQSLFRSLYELLRSLPEQRRRKLLKELLAWAGTEPMIRPTHRTLSHDEVFHLAEGELAEVGSHTVTHPVLSTLPVSAQRDEIEQSKVHLEGILGRPVTSFSYPHGHRSHETIAIVRQAGFAHACSTISDVVSPGTDWFQLPRVVTRDCDGDHLSSWLREWFCG